jgi:hypothetical protein
VDAFPRERVERGREGGDERLALPCLHLGDVALVEEQPAHDLHVEGAQAEGSAPGLADEGEGLGQEGVEALAASRPLAQALGCFAQPLVAEGARGVLAGVDGGHHGARGLDAAVVGGAEEAARQRGDAHGMLLVAGLRRPARGDPAGSRRREGDFLAARAVAP